MTIFSRISKTTAAAAATLVAAAIALTCATALGTSPKAFAEESLGSDNWKVTFTGSEMRSNFTSQDMADDIADLQPGDSVSFVISLDNATADATDWYMSNDIIQTLEDTQEVAVGGGYTYLLSYTDPVGNVSMLYDSERVGGYYESEEAEEGAGGQPAVAMFAESVESEDSSSSDGTSAPVGLHEVSDSLADFFFLSRLGANESASVKLVVMLDGETQGNVYQDTMAQLQMNFAAEPIPVEKVSENIVIPSGQGDRLIRQMGNVTSFAKTGDKMMITAYISLAIGVAGLIVLLIAIRRARSNKEDR